MGKERRWLNEGERIFWMKTLCLFLSILEILLSTHNRTSNRHWWTEWCEVNHGEGTRQIALVPSVEERSFFVRKMTHMEGTTAS